MNFTDKNVRRLPVRPHQHFVWDAGTGAERGLCVLVNPTGTKTYFVNYRFPGSPKLHYKKLGRTAEISVEDARAAARAARKDASQGKDPKVKEPVAGDTFEKVFCQYIEREQIGRNKNSSAAETRGVVLHNCADWKDQQIGKLGYHEVERLLEDIRDGRKGKPRPATAARVYSHLKDFFRWCALGHKYLNDNPMRDMPAPAKSKARDRHYSDDELRAIWSAADKLAPAAANYVKLMMLLGVRKDELLKARWDEFSNLDNPEQALFTVPTERVKLKASAKADKRPVYRVPLPSLALRILGKPGNGEVFPGVTDRALKASLVEHGAPRDFKLHTFRHTIATWLQNGGRSEFERGLVLNHSGGGSVTSGYSHGYPIDLKRTLLTEWADHVEGLVKPGEGVTLLR